MDAFGFPDKTQDYPQAQGLALSVIPWSAVFTWDLKNWQNAEITLSASTTFAAPVNVKKGRMYCIHLIQSGAGSFTVTWNAAFLNVSTVTLETAAVSGNFLTFKATSDTTLELIGNYTTTGVA